MDWGNAIVRSKTTDSTGEVTSMIMELNLEGDFRKTKKKITWLAKPTETHPLIPVTLLDYDYLITKKKLEETDDVADYVTPVTEFKEEALADANVTDLKKGDIMQFERKGYFVFDGEVEGVRQFIRIPDGKAANIASKAGAAAVPAPSHAQFLAPPASNMYKADAVYGDSAKFDTDTKMYKVASVYGS